VTDLVPERLQLARECGAVYTGSPEKTDVVAEVTVLEPLLLDVVFECCGKQEAIDQAISLLKPGGKLMVIGIPSFERWSFPVDQTRHKEICIQNVRRQNHSLEETLEMMEKGRIDVSAMHTHRFPFAKTKDAFDLVTDYRDGVMKAMVDFD
jgi:threonine dehydrogenase-like Zn-dependent dehydrogenase